MRGQFIGTANNKRIKYILSGLPKEVKSLRVGQVKVSSACYEHAAVTIEGAALRHCAPPLRTLQSRAPLPTGFRNIFFQYDNFNLVGCEEPLVA